MKIVGHRGARGLAPENTIAALQKGLEHKVDELEFDLRVTKDQVVILHHDPYLTDPDGQKHVIAESAFDDLLAHKPDLVTFEEVLVTIGSIRHSTRLHIEVKPNEDIRPIVKILRNHLSQDWKSEHFLLGSKSQRILQELHVALPDIQKVVIEPWSGVRATRRARELDTKRLSMNQLWLWRGFITPMARRGWELYPYTLNNVKKARRWEKYGIAGVITDYPDLFEK